jgi:Ca2+-binding RTX toxin-like protein
MNKNISRLCREMFSLGPRKSRTGQRTCRHIQPAIEALEDRRLMSGNPIAAVTPNQPALNALQSMQPGLPVQPVSNPNKPGITLQSNVLVIQGGAFDDNVVVALSNNQLKVTSVTPGPSIYNKDLGISLPGVPMPKYQFFDPAKVSSICFIGDWGNDSFVNQTAIPCVAYGYGSDNFVGGTGDDLLVGGADSNVFEGGGGNDTFVAGAGDNRFVFAGADLGAVTISGQAYHNTFDFSQFGPSGVMLDLGLAGAQTLHRGPKCINQKVGPPDLTLTLAGTADVQEVWGSPFGDTLKGGPGYNVIESGGGNDILVAGAGNNRFVFASTDLGAVTISGPANGFHNVLDFSQFGPGGITLDLRTTAMQTVHRSAGFADLQLKLTKPGVIQEVQGTAGADVIHAGDNDVLIHGNAGDDVIYGGQGFDLLYGDFGNDTFITIGGGAHHVFGGPGHNTFWVNDTDLTDYSPARDDLGSVSHLHAVASFFDYSYSMPNGEVAVSSTEDPLNTIGPARFSQFNPHGGILPEPITGQTGPDAWVYHDFSNDPLFSTSGPAPADVQQGRAATCYLMSYLGAVAKTDPDKIRQTVVDLGDGSYAVQFFTPGAQPVFVRVDGYLLTPQNDTTIQGAGPGVQSALWVPIIEKAWCFFRFVVKSDANVPNLKGTWKSISYSDGGNELNWAFNTPQDLTYNVTDNDNAAAVLNTINQELNQHKAVITWGPHPWWYNGPNDHTDTTDDGDHHHAGDHMYMVDHVDYVNGMPVDIVLRNPYGSNHLGFGTFDTHSANDGWVTIPADLFFYGCGGFTAFTV